MNITENDIEKLLNAIQFKVIANYPNSNNQIGDIISNRKDTEFGAEQIEYLSRFPAIFKKINQQQISNESNTPPLTEEYLNAFEKKVIDNTAELSDYMGFVETLKNLKIYDLFFSEMKKYEIFSIDQFLNERQKDKNDPGRNKYVDNAAIGIFKGIIKALKTL